jgi:hypothetical protein
MRRKIVCIRTYIQQVVSHSHINTHKYVYLSYTSRLWHLPCQGTKAIYALGPTRKLERRARQERNTSVTCDQHTRTLKTLRRARQERNKSVTCDQHTRTLKTLRRAKQERNKSKQVKNLTKPSSLLAWCAGAHTCMYTNIYIHIHVLYVHAYTHTCRRHMHTYMHMYCQCAWTTMPRDPYSAATWSV